MVTAEAAVVLPVLLVVLALAMFVLASVAGQLQCVDAARAAARLAARGEPPARVSAAAVSLGPPDAAVRLSSSGPMVRVTVTALVRPWGGALQRMPGVRVTATAAALREDSLGRSVAGPSGSTP